MWDAAWDVEHVIWECGATCSERGSHRAQSPSWTPLPESRTVTNWPTGNGCGGRGSSQRDRYETDVLINGLTQSGTSNLRCAKE